MTHPTNKIITKNIRSVAVSQKVQMNNDNISKKFVCIGRELVSLVPQYKLNLANIVFSCLFFLWQISPKFLVNKKMVFPKYRSKTSGVFFSHIKTNRRFI